MDLVPTGALHMERRPLQHPAQPQRRRRLDGSIQALHIVFQEPPDLGAQLPYVGAARPQHLGRLVVEEQRVEHVLHGDVFVTPPGGVIGRDVQRDIESFTQHPGAPW